jgi:hypothetical protein
VVISPLLRRTFAVSTSTSKANVFSILREAPDFRGLFAEAICMDDDSEHERERIKSGRPVKAIATTKLIQAGVIFQAICLEFGVTENEMRGPARSPNLRAARLEFCRRCEAAEINRPYMATLLNRNLSTIKQFLGLRPQPNSGSRPPLSSSAFEAQLTRGREILGAICAESGFTEEAIRSSAQTGTLPLARREFAHRCKAEKISARAIAELLGRDHTTIYSFSGGLPGSDGNPALGRLPAILQEVCAKYGVTAEALRSRKRSEILISARREFCQRCAAEDVGVTDIANALHRTPRAIYTTLEKDG